MNVFIDIEVKGFFFSTKNTHTHTNINGNVTLLQWNKIYKEIKSFKKILKKKKSLKKIIKKN